MSTQKSIKINFLMNVILTVSSFVFPFITFPYASRVLLPEGLGRVSFGMSLVTYFNMIAQLGIPVYGIRACARVRDDREELSRVVCELLTVNMIMTLLAYILFGVALLTVDRLREDRMLYVIMSVIIILNTLGMEWLYKGLELYTYITIRSIIFKAIAVLALLVFVHSKQDYLYYGMISIFAAGASNILNFINAHKYVDLRRRKMDLGKHMKPILVFFAMACATTVYTNLDTVMLGFMTDNESVGYYYAAVRIKSVLVSIVTSLGAVLLPRASYYVENGMHDEFRNISRKALNFILVIALPVAVFFGVYAMQGVSLFSGSAYQPAVVPMQVLMPTVFLIGLSNITGIQMLIPLGREKAVLYSEMVGAITDFLVNLILIPIYGVLGAAIGTLLAEILVVIVQLVYLGLDVVGMLSSYKYWKILLGVAFATVLSVGAETAVAGYVGSFTDGAVFMFVRLLVASIIFFGVYSAVMLLLREDMAIYIADSVKNAVCRRIRR